MKTMIDLGALYKMKRKMLNNGAELPMVLYVAVEGIKRTGKVGEIFGCHVFLYPAKDMPIDTAWVLRQADKP